MCATTWKSITCKCLPLLCAGISDRKFGYSIALLPPQTTYNKWNCAKQRLHLRSILHPRRTHKVRGETILTHITLSTPSLKATAIWWHSQWHFLSPNTQAGDNSTQCFSSVLRDAEKRTLSTPSVCASPSYTKTRKCSTSVQKILKCNTPAHNIPTKSTTLCTSTRISTY